MSVLIHKSPYMVSLDHVSVCYQIQDESILSFKEFVIRSMQGKIRHRKLIALNGINLEIKPSECFGIIGPNGAGKSTLLKIISRVLPPTSGRIIINGKVSPLLELGAGFHPELTGRENIFLNGTLLGYSYKEIKVHFDEILFFADVGDFIDSPLRTYSSGMVARLGFAIATSWIPEVLILDETLSVGDQEFRDKCSERIKSFNKLGSTILIASHDLGTLHSLCNRVLWLDKGISKMVGSADEVLKSYSTNRNL